MKEEKVMTREIVTEQQLLVILNKKIQQSPDCDGTSILGDLFLLENGPSGCNWGIYPRTSSENGPDQLCDERIRGMLEEACRSYNIDWDPS